MDISLARVPSGFDNPAYVDVRGRAAELANNAQLAQQNNVRLLSPTRAFDLQVHRQRTG